jgi:glycerol-3-phosphate acyltransferase PlsY
MDDWGVWAVPLLAAYLVGSIPFGVVLCRAIRGIDPRSVGSGNVGATNVGRVLGRHWFFVVLVLDAAKGALPVLLLPDLIDVAPENRAWLRVGCATAAMLGHVFSPFLRFRGGKGVATGAGAIAALHPLGGVVLVVTFLVVLGAFRYVSLASICAAWAYPLASYLLDQPVPVVMFASVAAVVVGVRHRANLARLMKGTEPRFRDPVKPIETEEPHGG